MFIDAEPSALRRTGSDMARCHARQALGSIWFLPELDMKAIHSS